MILVIQVAKLKKFSNYQMNFNFFCKLFRLSNEVNRGKRANPSPFPLEVMEGEKPKGAYGLDFLWFFLVSR